MEPNGQSDDSPITPAVPSASGVREVLTAVPVLARIAWFALGVVLGTIVTLLALLRPWNRAKQNDTALPYESFPFADNAGVCQEYVALARLRTSHEDARAIVQRLIPALPPSIRPENLRVVRAFARGDYWTIAVDAQTGAGDIARARQVASEMNAIAGTGLHFEPVFYSSRQLYETAQVLCMPRQSTVAR